MTIRQVLKLTHDAAMQMLAAAIAKAKEIDVPQNITIVDDGGNLQAFVRMDGAKFLSIETSRAKALTAASHRVPTGRIDPAMEMKFAVATGGKMVNLPGGLPIIVEGQCIGGIGVGSGTGAQDQEVARAALSAIGAKEEA